VNGYWWEANMVLETGKIGPACVDGYWFPNIWRDRTTNGTYVDVLWPPFVWGPDHKTHDFPGHWSRWRLSTTGQLGVDRLDPAAVALSGQAGATDWLDYAPTTTDASPNFNCNLLAEITAQQLYLPTGQIIKNQRFKCLAIYDAPIKGYAGHSFGFVPPSSWNAPISMSMNLEERGNELHYQGEMVFTFKPPWPACTLTYFVTMDARA